jgi:hypothetical protein
MAGEVRTVRLRSRSGVVVETTEDVASRLTVGMFEPAEEKAAPKKATAKSDSSK